MAAAQGLSIAVHTLGQHVTPEGHTIKGLNAANQLAFIEMHNMFKYCFVWHSKSFDPSSLLFCFTIMPNWIGFQNNYVLQQCCLLLQFSSWLFMHFFNRSPSNTTASNQQPKFISGLDKQQQKDRSFAHGRLFDLCAGECVKWHSIFSWYIYYYHWIYFPIYPCVCCICTGVLIPSSQLASDDANYE